MTNQFTATYKKLPTAGLLEILENYKDYKPIAVEAAKLELASRQDLDKAKLELKEKNNTLEKKKSEEKQKRKEISDKAFKVLEYADPLVEKTPEKSIVILCVILLSLFLYHTATYSYMIVVSFKDIGEGDFSTYLFLTEYLYLPVTILFLWRKTKAGWVLFFIWLVYNIVSDLMLLYMNFKMIGADEPFIRLMPGPGFSGYLYILIFHSALFYFINKRNVRTLFIKPKNSKSLPEEQVTSADL